MSIHPREYDAVLGSNNSAAPTDAVLGGIEGVKRRLPMEDIESRIIALSQALNYGEAGLDIVIQALQDRSKQIQWSAYGLLVGKTEIKVEQALQSFSLISEAGIDYSSLQYLLVSQEWEKADEQTRKLVLQAAERSDNWLRNEDIQSLACEDLFIIDRLWTIYSEGRFGFSVQKRIGESLASETGDISRGKEFSDRVGWHKQRTETDSYYDVLNLYTIKRREDIPCGLNAPEGNLPSICEFGGGELLSWYDPPDTESTMGFYGGGGYRNKWSEDSFFGAEMVACFLKRIQACPEIP
ncbi:GUN4 domain-containing protein [Microcoleus sp. Pol12B4]|uniref:GUN4 domain-containing protein n=1 Tax=Microcoleus sp. Pol12B4 TaxID=3055395 RepID=UPI002FD4307B